MSTEMSANVTGQDLYAQVEAYPWNTDPEFQGGLSAILGSNTSPEQAAELALRARCFYYARKFGTHVDFDTYKAYRESHSLPSPAKQSAQPPPNGSNGLSVAGGSAPQATTVVASSGAPAEAPYPTSFQDIVDLITSGKPIPGIKEIPSTILEGQGTQPAKGKRRKPWEKTESSPDNTVTFPTSAHSARP